MSRVLASGKFDLLHPGHIYYLEKSANLSENGELWVVITHEDNIENNLFSNQERKGMLESIKVVDKVVVGKKRVDYEKIIEETGPDIISIGYDQDKKKLRKNIKNLYGEVAIEKIGSYRPGKYSSTIFRNTLKENVK